MTINEIIESALPIAGKYAPGNVAPLQDMQKALAQAGLKVVVLGDFKAGKSTIINTLFLKEELLPRNYAEATAVPTYVTSGSTLLQTWKRNDDGTESLVESMESFTADDIMEKVTAKTDEERAAKAEQYSRVVLQKPGILPEGITLVDTPGLDTPNVRICIGTKDEARTADAVIYVKRASELSQREVDYIKTLSGGVLHKIPVHVVLTDDGGVNGMGALRRVEDSIQAKLRNHGIAAQTSVFIFGKDEQGGEAVLPELSPLGEQDATAVQVPPLTKNRDIRRELAYFFASDVQNGRKARIARHLAPALADIAMCVQERLDAAAATDAQVAIMEEELRREKEEYLRTIDNLLADVGTAQRMCLVRLQKRMDDKKAQYFKDFDSANSIVALKQKVTELQQKIVSNMQTDIELELLQLEIEEREIGQNHRKGLGGLKIQGPDVTEAPYGGAIGGIPAWLACVMDSSVVLTLIASLVLRLPLLRLAGSFPVINNILLREVALMMLRDNAKSHLEEALERIKGEVSGELRLKLDEHKRELEVKLKNDTPYEHMMDAIREVKGTKVAPGAIVEMKTCLARIKEWRKVL